MKYYPGWSVDTAHRIAREHGFTLEELRKQNRSPDRVAARRAVVRHLRDDAGWSLPRIGRYLHRDHSTIRYLLGGTPSGRAALAKQAAQQGAQEGVR